MKHPALGLIETCGLDSALVAIKAATKAGDVVIASAERLASGHTTVKIEGEWTVVQKAVEAGARAVDRDGELVSMHLLPRTDEGVRELLPYRKFVEKYLPSEANGVVPTPKRRPKPKAAKPQPQAAPPTPKPQPTVETVAPVTPVEPAPPIPVVTPEPTYEATPPETKAPEVRDVPEALPVVDEPTIEELEKLSVVKLRQYARGLTNLPIQGRQISMANKGQLLDAIRAARGATTG